MSGPDQAPATPANGRGHPDELDIPYSLIFDLALRRCLLDGTSSIGRLSSALGLPGRVVEQVFEDLRRRKYLEVQGLSGQDYIFTLTGTGIEQATARFARVKYAQAAPVSLASYTEVVIRQRARPRMHRPDVLAALSDLVVDEDLVDQIGPAFAGQGSLFLHGPSGTGKTAVAERLGRLFDDGALIPRAVEADGQIITVFDPLVHEPIDPQPVGLDPRWVACYRPVVTVGGELDLDMLQLRFDPTGGTYSAPLQMRANNGILIIDDFGRQRVTPQALLNRWIVPLDRRVDHLTLQHGQKLVIPFELMVVFATNLDPGDLGEDAFFRRIQTKVHVGPIDKERFDRIVLRAADEHGVRVAGSAAAYLRHVCLTRGSGRLLACYPTDFCRLAVAIAGFEDQEAILDEATIERAARLYFSQAPPQDRSTPLRGNEAA